ncbi:unnamed protein product [Periconia digitata]|uniref:Uncharacterized protein n=1 Tax=Periconia digitata TaxID=1303443 RepID=A0A9W4XI15_9PLEO|nr:unnamed protein product [Periconia digitata]
MLRQKPQKVDLLILGAGWTSTFLIPLLETEKVSHAETTTTGRDNTIPFQFDPSSTSTDPYENLPTASTILITFPLKGQGQSKRLTDLYRSVHGETNNWIQLGSTFIFDQVTGWNDENSPYDKSDARAIAEDELMECVGGCALDLVGLYGGTRVPRTWIPRLAKCKDDVKKRSNVHFVHGEDVARAILLTHRNFTRAKRWIVADTRSYDWWDLILSFSAMAEGGEGVMRETEEQREQRLTFGKWVGELMAEEGVRALPRDVSSFERRIDSRGFWKFHGEWPKHARLA